MLTYADSDERPLPADDAGELAWLLYRQHQVIARRQALRFMTDPAIRAQLDAERWQVAAHGVYLTHNGPVTRQQHR